MCYCQAGGSCGTGGRWARRAGAAGALRGGTRARGARGRLPSDTRTHPRAKPSLPGNMRLRTHKRIETIRSIRNSTGSV